MNHPIGFSEALEAVEQLDPEAQAEIVSILNRRLAERGRERLVATVDESRREFANGQCLPMNAAEIIREAKQ